MRRQLPFASMFFFALGCGVEPGAGRLAALTPLSEAKAASATSFDEVIDAYLARGQLSGAVLIERNGTLLYQKSAQLGDTPAGDAATRFRIGSVTKQFTAAAILELEEQGKLAVSDTLAAHWPNFPHGRRLTLRMLLSHTSGLDDDWMGSAEFGRIVEQGGSLEEIVRLIAATAAPAAPGTRFGYANANYMLLGRLIETVSGQSYERFLADAVLAPAGLTEVGVATGLEPVPGGVDGYAWDARGDALVVPEWVQYGVAYSSGSIYASPRELCQWHRALAGNVVLSSTSREAMETPVLSGYGYGVGIGAYGGHRSIQHSGAIEGFRTAFLRLVDDDVCIVVAANVEPTPAAEIGEALAKAYLGLPTRLPPRPVMLSPAELERFAGRYRDAAGHVISLNRVGATLRLSHGSDLRDIKLVFDGPDSAFLRQVDGSVRFLGENTLEMTLYGDRVSARRE